MQKCAIVFAATVCLAAGSASADWPRFRGPNGAGVHKGKPMPVTWDAETNIAWKTALPGAGAFSPVILGDALFVTSYSGYDRSQKSREMGDLKHHVARIDIKTGKVLWDRELAPKLPLPIGGYGGTRHHGYASSTPVVDKDAVYAFFGRSGVFAFDHDGKQLWRAEVGGTRTDAWGSAASPILHGDLLIVNAGAESQALIALDRKTGKEVWRTPGMKRSWSVPIIVKVDGKDELVMNVAGAIKAFDPLTGKDLWICGGARDYVCSSVVENEGIIYSVVANTHGGSGAQAIRMGGRGDVAASHIVWKIGQGSAIGSPVYADGRIYYANITMRVNRTRQKFYCVDAKTGQVVYAKTVDPAPTIIYSSPLLADGKLYYVTQKSGTWVIAAGPEFKVLSHNVIVGDDGSFNASPVPLDNGRLLLRSDNFLYCIGATPPQD
jgi:outer membrane protein assembly factor BamB